MDVPDGSNDTCAGRRLPSLGPRGEGWVAVQGVLILAAAAAGLHGPRWPHTGRPPRLIAAVSLSLAGAGLMAGGVRGLGREVTPFSKPVVEGELRQNGVYALARHPIYGGVLLLAWGWSLPTSPAACVPVALAVPFLESKRCREETWLAERHPDHEDYRRRVRRRFIPFVW